MIPVNLNTLTSLATSPRVLFWLAAAMLLCGFVASVVQDAVHAEVPPRPPKVAGYRQVSIEWLSDERFAASLDGQRIWITGGVACGGDCLVAPFRGDHPNGGPFIQIAIPPRTSVHVPETQWPFSPYGVFHKAGTGGWLSPSITVGGEFDPWMAPSPPAPAADVAVTLAVAVGLWATVAAVLRNLQQRQRRFGLGMCAACGYDLRATPGHCPECGRSVNRGRRNVA